MFKPSFSSADLADHLLATDPYLLSLADELWRAQRRLKRAAGPEVVRLYLRLEELSNERLFALVERVWAEARARGRNPRTHRDRPRRPDCPR